MSKKAVSQPSVIELNCYCERPSASSCQSNDGFIKSVYKTLIRKKYPAMHTSVLVIVDTTAAPALYIVGQ